MCASRVQQTNATMTYRHTSSHATHAAKPVVSCGFGQMLLQYDLCPNCLNFLSPTTGLSYIYIYVCIHLHQGNIASPKNTSFFPINSRVFSMSKLHGNNQRAVSDEYGLKTQKWRVCCEGATRGNWARNLTLTFVLQILQSRMRT